MGRRTAVALLLAAVAACRRGGDRGSRRQVRVAAAADLNAALGELASAFTAAQHIDVAATYGSSGTLFSQLMNGAPYDLFLSADVEYPRRLAARGLTVAGSEFHYARGRLVIWTRESSRLDIAALGLRVAVQPGVTRVSLANPEHAPYGRAAVAALRAAGVYDEVQPRLVYGENVAQAMQFVQSGSADVGLVAMSLAVSPAARDRGRWVEVPPGDYPPLEQAGVIMKTAADVDAARAFAAFLSGAAARAILQQYGFTAPEH
jgi:molybdate transport system substrate-binding protein